MHRKFSSFLSVFSLLALVAAPTARAIEPGTAARKADDVQDIQTVEMFQGIEEGQIEVNFYPKDASQATVVIRNKGDKPINVAVPKAFGAVHVLGQMGMGGMGGMGGGMGGMGGGMGGMGGGMGGMGGGMGGMGGMFRIEPDKSRKMKVPCVCLEHGKIDPNPRMKYKIVPIEQINDDPRVAQLCGLLGFGQVPQNTAQAAAWHLASGLSWDELLVKNRVESQYTGNIRFFNPLELRNAFQLSTLINRQYEQSRSSEADSPGYATPVSAESSSSSDSAASESATVDSTTPANG